MKENADMQELSMSEEALQRHREMGFEPGWTQVAAQLAELAEAEERAAA